MSTNFYARILPPKVKREILKELIDVGDYETILQETHNLYDNFSVNYDGKPSGGVVHLGKRSSGWKFLWNPNMYIIRHFHKVEETNQQGSIVSRYVDDPSTVYDLYPLTKEGIKAFVNREDIVVVDEYGEKQDKEKFLEMAFNWEQKDGWDACAYDKYEKKRNSDHNPWVMTGDLIDYLRDHGYAFTNFTNSDFYSDGLRFATCTDFN